MEEDPRDTVKLLERMLLMINDEDSILSNNTWVLVDLPPGSNTIGCKWVFRRKYRTDGTIQTFKVRLVAKGFRQREGIDYFDTYAPVARITSIRVLIALASIYKLVVHQMDVKTAFLNGDLDEEVYMDQPEGFVLPGKEKKVCKLVKSLYGLKQAPKQWHEKFDIVILANGFKHNGADEYVYSKFTSEYEVIVCLYVDDMLIFGTNMLGVCETKKYLASVFKMKDLNETDIILAFLNGDLDEEVYMDQPEGFVLPGNEKKVYIAFAVNRLSRYTSNPSAEHWKAIARVLGYLKKTKDIGLYYSGYPAVLKGYSDANWVTSVGDNKSTSGWIFTLGKKAEWLRNMLYDIELWPQLMDIKKELHLCEHRSGAASKQELRSSRLDLTDFTSLEFLPNPVYWTTNPVDWMTCTWLIQSPGLVVQSTGCRA
uniref:Reverse transcriptase Ty1/copia-type domain-containing protein n=1 Tax=Fagus sylvatica TaxID=28930 RepID=A0A2N9I931_FAGSY